MEEPKIVRKGRITDIAILKQRKVLIIAVFCMTILLITSSYALLSSFDVTDNVVIYGTGELNMSVNNITGLISLNEKFPESDEEGLSNATPITLTFTNTGTLHINQYTVKLVSEEGKESNLSEDYIKYAISLDGTNYETPKILSSVGNAIYIGYDQKVGASKTIYLKVWLDEESGNAALGKVYYGSIKVELLQEYKNLDESGANPPLLSDNMIPVYYDKISDTEGVWRKADKYNISTDSKWYNYNEYMWANAVTVRNNILIDYSGNNYHGTFYNGAKIAYDNEENQYAMVFDGVDDYIQLPEIPGTVDFESGFTVEFEAKWDALNNNSRIFDFGNGADSNNIIIANVGTTNRFCVSFRNSAVPTEVYIENGIQVGVKNKYSVVVKKNASIYIVTVYKNGSIISTNDFGSNPYRNITRTINYIAKSNWTVSSDGYFKGKIYNFKITLEDGSTLMDYAANNNNNNFSNLPEGTEIPMRDITTMWVWVPRYKYTIFNGNNGTIDEQLIDVEFERYTKNTGSVACVDDIKTADNSTSSEKCTDSVNGSIINGKSTYTHPAFTNGTTELTGIWMAKFEPSTEQQSICTENKSAVNCDKVGLDIYIKPNNDILNYISISNMFANIRRMESYGNIHGFSQNSGATTWLNASGQLTGEIANDNNNLDTHMIKNMEWGAVAYLSNSKYGKYGNDLYSGSNKEIYVNNYYDAATITIKTGYSGGNNLNTTSTTNTYKYNDLTISTLGQGYRGAGASTTGTVYGVYDMSGGGYDRTMANMVNATGEFNVSAAGTWTTTIYPLAKYYDKYSYSISEVSNSRGKLGDATREILKISNNLAGGWNNSISTFINGATTVPWICRGGAAFFTSATTLGVMTFVPSNAGPYESSSYRAILVINP